MALPSVSESTVVTKLGPDGWTISLKEYYDKVSELEEKLHVERDRRYSEVAQERKEALRIKEEADEKALGLAREIQVYKDEKANELRAQLTQEREDYARKTDLDSFKRELLARSHWSWQQILAFITILVGIAAIYFKP